MTSSSFNMLLVNKIFYNTNILVTLILMIVQWTYNVNITLLWQVRHNLSLRRQDSVLHSRFPRFSNFFVLQEKIFNHRFFKYHNAVGLIVSRHLTNATLKIIEFYTFLCLFIGLLYYFIKFRILYQIQEYFTHQKGRS